MADVNALIAQGTPAIQLENPINQMAKIMSIRNAQQEYDINAQKLTEANALRDFLKGKPDLNKPDILSQLTTGFGTTGLAYGTKLQELQRAQQDAAAKAFDLADKKTKYFRGALDRVNTPEDAQMWTAALFSDPDVGPFVNKMGVPLETVLSHVPKTLGADFNAWKTQAAMGADKFAEMNKPHFVTQDIGGSTRVIAMPSMGGAAEVVPGSVATKSLTPGEAKPTVSNIDVGGSILTQEYDPVTQTTRIVSRQGKSLTPEQARIATQERTKVAHTTTDEAGNVTLYNAFGEVIPAKSATGGAVPLKGKPSATFEKAKNQREQLQKDLGTAIAEIKDITKDGGLIDQSTGSGLGRARDVTAGFFGQATEGAVAAAKLKPIADLALKMVPRFEGPQSDKDTQSYKEAAGQLADSSLPSKIRKEAGKTVLRLMENRKGQFVTEGMAAEGTGAAGGVDANNPLLK